MSGTKAAMRWMKEHPERRKINKANSLQLHRAWMRNQKRKPCVDCGIQYPPCVMDFDHVRGEKLFSIGGGASSKSYTQLEIEIEKCELVCANCHRIRTEQRREYARSIAIAN